MKAILWAVVCLVAISAYAKEPAVQFFGAVRAENSRVDLGILSIENWKQPDRVVADVDSGLASLRFKRELVLQLAPCAGVDSATLSAILGRFTGKELNSIKPRGEWQFSQPVLIMLADSSACPPALELNQLRWVEIQYGSDLKQAVARASRLGEMYREQQLGPMNGIFRR
ncbi:MAG TPA: hypothetical protein VGL38_08730 [bacterium]|jgi:hypothetical protein